MHIFMQAAQHCMSAGVSSGELAGEITVKKYLLCWCEILIDICLRVIILFSHSTNVPHVCIYARSRSSHAHRYELKRTSAMLNSKDNSLLNLSEIMENTQVEFIIIFTPIFVYSSCIPLWQVMPEHELGRTSLW